MSNNISILLADDHPMLLKGLTDELVSLDYIVYSASNGAQALDLIIAKNPTIAFLDFNMPYLTGFEVIKKCQSASLKTKFIILTSYREKGSVLKAKQMKLSGYLLKDEPFSIINECLQIVLTGGFYASAQFDEIFSNKVSSEIKKIKRLSPSEKSIIRLISHDNSTKKIAEILSVSRRTIDKHRSNIIKKLELTSVSDALYLWVKENKVLLENV